MKQRHLELGHEEASGTKYVPKELMNYWVKAILLSIMNIFNGVRHRFKLLETFKKNIRKEIIAVKKAFSEEPLSVNSEKELADVYAPFYSKKRSIRNN